MGAVSMITIQTSPIAGQKSGTSGLLRKTRDWMAPQFWKIIPSALSTRYKALMIKDLSLVAMADFTTLRQSSSSSVFWLVMARQKCSWAKTDYFPPPPRPI